MSFRNKYTLRFAEDRDNEGIRQVFESGSFSGGISIQYLRGDRPLDSLSMDGEYARIVIAVDNESGRIAGVGGAVARTEYINGKAEKCAYFTGMKLHPDYRGKMPHIAEAYRMLLDSLSDCACFYTTILDDNTPVIAMLEKRRKSMPAYNYLGHYTTYCFHGGKKMIPLEKNNLDGFDRLMDTHFREITFTPVNYRSAGFGETEFFCVRDKGEITACCFIGNQQGHKQYKMCSYGGVYKFISRLPTRLMGYPAFPRPDSLINYGTVSYLYVKDNDPKLCSDFLRSAAAQTDFSLLIWGGFENDPLCGAMDKMKAVRYGSRLYTVGEAVDIHGVIGVEAALL